jgi:hypothetical protein
MFGMLEIAFGEDGIARRGSILSEGEVFLADLMRRAANAYIRAVAVENLVTVGGRAAPLAVMRLGAIVMPAIMAAASGTSAL